MHHPAFHYLMLARLILAFPPIRHSVAAAACTEPMTLTHTHEHYQPSKTTLSFSTSALKTQAQCPFKSLIIHQLNTPNETEPQLGLTPSRCGALVHEVIERLHKTHFDTQNTSVIKHFIKPLLMCSQSMAKTLTHKFI